MKLLQLYVQIRNKKKDKEQKNAFPTDSFPLSRKSQGSILSPKRLGFMALSRHFLPANRNFLRKRGKGLAWLAFMEAKNKLSQ